MSVNKLPTRVEKSITNLVKEEEYLTYDVVAEKIATNGSNYLGELYEVDVKGKTKDQDKITNLFLKVNNGGDSTKQIFINELYQIELFAYKQLSKVFAELQEDANVPSSERYKFVTSYEESSQQVIILENIARTGFETYHRKDVVPLDFAEMSMKKLAKLHGLSFALQQKRPDYFDKTIKGMKYPVIYCDDWSEFVKSMINITMVYIDDSVKSRVEEVYNELADKYAQFFEDDATRRCICHGDYRSNNIMITRNDGKITDSMVVDYQFVHYGCPAMDVIYFFFISTDHNFRSAHMPHLKNVYHETLSTFLKYFNLDANSIYPRDMFERDFKAKLCYGLTIGFTFVPLTLVNEDDVPDVTGDYSGMSFQVDDKYRDRQQGMIDEFIKWGYL